MLKQRRWADWPQTIRWLTGGAVAVLLALAIAWLLFVVAADWLAHQDVGAARGQLLQTARDAARGRLLTLGAGLLAAGALVFTARNFTLSREGQVTDRYSKAITQLGDQKLDVRIGGIYALERVASDSARDHPTVVEVLAAFVREHSAEHRPAPAGNGGPEPAQRPRPDVQAALTVIARRNAKRDIRRVDLTGAVIRGATLVRATLARADLTGTDLPRADLTFANLTDANLFGATLADTDLAGANLTRANLTKAHLVGVTLLYADLLDADLNSAYLNGAYVNGANLTHAYLNGADLTRARLGDATLTGADLASADLTDANLTDANLTDARLNNADLTLADLTGADLTGAILIGANLTNARLNNANLTNTNPFSADLTSTDLTSARWPDDVPIPQGWQARGATRRLIRQP